MDLQLTGKSALVTGSTAGIGLAIARLLAREGAHVIVNGRTQQRVDQAVKEIAGDKNQATGVAADVSTADGCKTIIAKHPRLDILVNNAGIFRPTPFEKISDEEWLELFQANVMSGVRLSRHYFPLMLKQNWGRILFISSESALQIPKEMIHYGTTKTAQLAVARGLAEMTAGTSVTVNSVLPGPTASEGVETFVGQMADSKGVSQKQVEKEFFQSVRPSSLLKRFATTEEVANLVVYLCSPLAAATNGAAMRADGGVVQAIA